MVQYLQIINITHQIHKIKDEYHMIISTDVGKAFDDVQHPFMIKTLSKVGIEGAFLNIIKAIYERPTANINNNPRPACSGDQRDCTLNLTVLLP